MNWADFGAREPELARLGEQRLDAHGVLLLATLRRDGHPRISPVEPVFCDGELELGMMPRSMKALDLLRDPRCTLHSTVTDRNGGEGDFKLYGRARELRDPRQLARYGEVLFAKIGWRPAPGEGHVFAIDVLSIGYTRFQDGKMEKRAWHAG